MLWMPALLCVEDSKSPKEVVGTCFAAGGNQTKQESLEGRASWCQSCNTLVRCQPRRQCDSAIGDMLMSMPRITPVVGVLHASGCLPSLAGAVSGEREVRSSGALEGVGRIISNDRLCVTGVSHPVQHCVDLRLG